MTWGRILRLLSLAMLIAVTLATTATAGQSRCTHGVSEVGPVVLVNGHLVRDAKPHTEACLP